MCLQQSEKGQWSGHSNRLSQELERLQVLDPRFKRRRAVSKQALGAEGERRAWRTGQRGPRCAQYGHRSMAPEYVHEESGANDGSNHESHSERKRK